MWYIRWCFFTHRLIFLILWYYLQYVCRFWISYLSPACISELFLFSSLFAGYYIWIRLTLWELTSAIPLTYWIVISVILSNGLSLLCFLFSRCPLYISPTYEIFSTPFLVRTLIGVPFWIKYIIALLPLFVNTILKYFLF